MQSEPVIASGLCIYGQRDSRSLEAVPQPKNRNKWLFIHYTSNTSAHLSPEENILQAINLKTQNFTGIES